MVGEILRVNMSRLECSRGGLPDRYRLLGGRALTSRVVADEVDPACDPLGEGNILVLAPGLLSGTAAPCSGRLSVGGKSLLTGGIKEANAGGPAAQKLASLGLRAVIVEGKAAEGPYILRLNGDGACLEPAANLAGLGCYEVAEKLHGRYGEHVTVLSIGPAGEHMMSAAGISCTDMDGNPGRFAARGGLGAVMGSKGLKAIVIDSRRHFDAPVADPAGFKEIAKKLSEIILSHPATQTLAALGTACLVNMVNEVGGFPTRNFSSGRFEGAERLSGETIAAVIASRGGKVGHPCHPGCIIRCSNVYIGPDGKPLCAPLEYENVWALGANCGIDDLDTIARLNRLCNDIGVDTIETGVAIGVAMEAGVLSFGDGENAALILDNVRRGTPLGEMLGNGAVSAGRIYRVQRVPAVKGQAMSAYDPRAIKGMGVTFATSTMGADHTAGMTTTANVMCIGGIVDPLGTEGQVELSRRMQVLNAALDCTGLCLFAALPFMDFTEAWEHVAGLISTAHGTDLTFGGFTLLGVETLRTERAFNVAAGLGPDTDRLPEFMLKEKLPPHNTVFDVPAAELARALDIDDEVAVG